MPDYNQQRVGAPYGDIYFVETPHMDRLADRIYAEQRQREIYRQQQNKMLDDEFARNMSGIRDIDIGKLTQQYGDYKLGYQQLLKRKEASPQEQLEVLRKKAAIYETLNKSKQEKAWEDQQQKLGNVNKNGEYADDWQDILLKRRNTPLANLNPEEDKKLMYPYHLPNIDKEIKYARGDMRDVTVPVKGKSAKGELYDDKNVYKVASSPNEFANRLGEKVLGSNEKRHFEAAELNKYSDEGFENLVDRYNARVNDPEFIDVYGQPKPLPSMDTRFGKALAIRTMEEFADMKLNPKPVSELNADRAMKARQTFAQEQQARAHKNSLARLFVYANIQDRKPETIGRNIDNLIAQHIEDARGNNGEVVTDNATFEAITGKKKYGSSVLMFDEPNNKYIYGSKDDTGKVTITGEVPVDLGRIKLTKVYKSGLDAKYNTDKKIDVAPSTYLIKGKKYTEAELIKMGYTVDQIKPYKQ